MYATRSSYKIRTQTNDLKLYRQEMQRFFHIVLTHTFTQIADKDDCKKKNGKIEIRKALTTLSWFDSHTVYSVRNSCVCTYVRKELLNRIFRRCFLPKENTVMIQNYEDLK